MCVPINFWIVNKNVVVENREMKLDINGTHRKESEKEKDKMRKEKEKREKILSEYGIPRAISNADQRTAI